MTNKPITYRGIRITYHDVSLFRSLTVVAIHLYEPTEHELADALERAHGNQFQRICIYKRHLKLVA